MVDEFHSLVSRNDGKSDGAPGILHYYGWFVLDPEGE